MGDTDPKRYRFMVTQLVENEIDAGMELLGQLAEAASQCKRQPVPISKLRVGLKCGGSDGFSGITANPLLGAFSDWLTGIGGTTVLTEVPEMFGAEQILMARAASRDVFDKTVKLINDFKHYYVANKQPIYENPSPGNKAGGISTLEEKSLGCTQKAGCAIVRDVLPYTGRISKPGLNLLSAPGNDGTSVTALAASGCHMVLFTTGRGTPLGGIVPTVKVATNSSLAERKGNWIDYNAGPIATGQAPVDDMVAPFSEAIRSAIEMSIGFIFGMSPPPPQTLMAPLW